MNNNKKAMVSVVHWQPTGRLMVQADRLGPKVGSHLVLCCIQRMKWVNSRNALSILTGPYDYPDIIIILLFMPHSFIWSVP